MKTQIPSQTREGKIYKVHIADNTNLTPRYGSLNNAGLHTHSWGLSYEKSYCFC